MTAAHIIITAAFAAITFAAGRSIWRDITRPPGSIWCWHWDDAP